MKEKVEKRGEKGEKKDGGGGERRWPSRMQDQRQGGPLEGCPESKWAYDVHVPARGCTAPTCTPVPTGSARRTRKARSPSVEVTLT